MTRKLNAPGSKHHGKSLDDIPKGDLDEMPPEHRRALDRFESTQKFVGIAEEFAEHKVFYRNYKYDVNHKIFPGELDYDRRLVDKCYPYAKGGMLLVDEPRNRKKLQEAEEVKRPKLRAAGFRYVIVKDYVEVGTDELKMETTLQDLGEQLGET